MDNLGAREVEPSDDEVKRPEAAADFEPGLASPSISETSSWVLGAAQAD